MKKLPLTLITILAAINFSHAQWTTSGSNIYNSNTGNVGINTSSPVAKLDVNAVTIVSGVPANIDPAAPAVNPNVLANTGQMLIGWNRTAGTGETDFISNQGLGSGGGFAFYNHDNSNNETQLMWLLGNGNLLIGKTSQANSGYKLDINGNVRANQVVINSTGADFVFAPTYHLNSLANVKKYIDKNHHLPEIASAKEMQTNGLNVGENQTKLLQKVEELTLYLIEEDKEKKQQQQVNELQSKLLKTQQAQIAELNRKLNALLKTRKN